MPIYEYECRSCAHVFDVLQKMGDDPLTECPKCGRLDLRKLLSAPNFRLKGGGWYETDFKTDNKRNLAESPDRKSKAADGDKKSTGSDDKKGESKSKSGSDSKSSGGGDQEA
ncbi:uncharacterized protein METZ01_LOCUS426857 [marine metagenome]|uniref:Putative regulatory protein FmdB zinc ribbon domain-containing protein n=1 Tax=marine metagenome TaxID=408172 RepID=A0A382XSP2_9ZZZZ